MSPTSAPPMPTRPLDRYRPDPAGGGLTEHHVDLTLPPAEEDRATFEVPGLPGSFCLHYQPEIDLRTGTVVACEALLRWQHPDFGLLRPGVTLEGSRWHDRLPGIETWAMTQVCRQAATWRRHSVRQTALNVSATHLMGPTFFDSLDRAIGESGIDPEQLAIDIPIGVAAADPGLLRYIARELAERGVGVVIDGVGASATHAVLQQVPASVWKIDLGTAGARRPGLHRSVVRAVSEARAAGVVTTAKAVEDLDLLEAVRDLEFDRAFGYAISQAVHPTAMRAIAARGAVTAGPLFGPRAD